MVRDMTTGNSAKQILKFSLPLLIGTVFQQFYNMVDSIIVGKFLGTQPFAAVGMTGSIRSSCSVWCSARARASPSP